MPSKRFKIEKVPLTYVPVEHQPVFPNFPILYLELIENKEKVIPALKNKSEDPIFLPNVPNQIIQELHPYAPINENKEFFDERDIRHKLQDRMKRGNDMKPTEDRDRKSARERMDERHRDEIRVKELSAARKKESRSLPKDFIPVTHQPSLASQSQEESIRSILGGVATSIPVASAASTHLPPTLSEINTHNSAHAPVKNLSYTDTGDEIKRKRELLFRFDILKKSYKDAVIPEFSEYTDIATMEQVYEDMVRKVGLDSKVEGYKKFLTMGFFGIEFLFSNVFKVDMAGFAKQQLSSMNSYERILIELGEKAMIEKSKSQWPAEIRLLFTIVMNAVIFLLMKNVMSGGLTNIIGSLTGASAPSTGSQSSSGDGMGMMSGIMNMMSGLGGGGSSAPPPSKPKQKMKGPSINLDDMDKKQL
jgi:hypothetical protein